MPREQAKKWKGGEETGRKELGSGVEAEAEV